MSDPMPETAVQRAAAILANSLCDLIEMDLRSNDSLRAVLIPRLRTIYGRSLAAEQHVRELEQENQALRLEAKAYAASFTRE